MSYLTVQPDRSVIDDYIAQMSDQLLDDKTELWFTGWLTQFINREKLSDRVVIFDSISELVEKI
jgi:hypothetical protein